MILYLINVVLWNSHFFGKALGSVPFSTTGREDSFSALWPVPDSNTTTLSPLGPMEGWDTQPGALFPEPSGKAGDPGRVLPAVPQHCVPF